MATEEPAVAPTRSPLDSFLLPSLIDGMYVHDDMTDEYRLPKSSDIPDLAFLSRLNYNTFTTTDMLVNDIGFPKKVVLAKARKLINKELIIGCICGRCEGYFEITLLGYNLLNGVMGAKGLK